MTETAMGPLAVIWLLSSGVVIASISSISATSCNYEPIWPSADNDGYLSSPDYPEMYAPSQCIMWYYHGQSGMNVTVRIVDLDIPSHNGYCDMDRLMIGPIHKTSYCGNSLEQEFEQYTAELNRLQSVFFVLFNSTDEGAKGRGFKVYYKLSFPRDDSKNISNPSPVTPSTTTSTTTTTTTTAMMQHYPSVCQYVLHKREGEIILNSDSLYLGRGFCAWFVYDPLVSPGGGHYKLHFDDCQIGYSDTLVIYDGRSLSDSRSGSYQGHCPKNFTSSGNGFIITFSVNDYRNSQYIPLKISYHFNLENHFESPTFMTNSVTENITRSTTTNKPLSHESSSGCTTTLGAESGQITGSDFLSPTNSRRICTILLYNPATDGHDVTYLLTFESFHLFPESILNIYDGNSTLHNILASYEPPAYPTKLISKKNSILLQFKPEPYFLQQGQIDAFKIRYNMHVNCPPYHETCGYEEFSCFKADKRCNGIWDCPLHGGDERGCSEACPVDFSCDYRSPYCYTESDRCNGKGTCSNYVDEMGCNPQQCSPDKGLFLCSNGRCIYDKWRCDRTNDCADNSDEADCSSLSSPRVVVAAVVGSLACSLLLVIALGCVCKVYQLRVHQLRGGPRHDTPFSRQLAEMFLRRAPPPPYHEAMLTSRPYDEAYLELISQNENQPDSSEPNSGGDQQQNNSSAAAGERPRRVHRHGDRRCRHGHHHRDVNQTQSSSSRLRAESSGLFEVGTLSLVTEVMEDGAHGQSSSRGHGSVSDEPPPYSESDLSHLAVARLADSSSDSGDDFSEDDDNDDDWQEEDAGSASRGSSGSADSSAQTEMLPGSTRDPADSSVSHSRNSNNSGRTGLEGGNHNDGYVDSDKDVETASTSLSVDSADPPQLVEENDDKIPEQMTVLEDSDSECILHEDDGVNEGDDDNDTDSDTACLLSRV